MHFVDADRLVAPATLLAVHHPRFILPEEVRFGRHHGIGIAGRRERARVGIGADDKPAVVAISNLELILRAGLYAGDERLPDAAVIQQLQGIAAPIPIVEVADDAHAAGMRCPGAKAYLVLIAFVAGMSSELAVRVA